MNEAENGRPDPMETEECCRALIDEAPDGIFIADTDGRYVESNRSGCEMLGHTRDELLRLRVLDTIIPEEAPALAATLIDLKAGRTVARDWRMRRKDGSVMVAELNARMLRDGRILGIMRDMTKRRDTEFRVRASEEKFRLLMERANDPIFMADPDSGRIIDCNARAETLLGLSRSQIIGMHQAQLHPPEEADRYRRIFLDHVQRGSAIEEDVYVVRSDGKLIPVDISASVFEIGGHKILHAHFRDLTERRRQADILAKSQAVAHIGGWEVDMVTKTLYWTDETYRIHDLTPADYTPAIETAISFYTPESAELITTAVKAAMLTGQPYDLELELVTARQRRIWVRTAGEVQKQAGRVTKIYGVFQDITERKRMETLQRVSQQRLSYALEGSHDGLWDWNILTGEVFFSDRLVRMLDYEPGDLAPHAGIWEGLIHEEDQERVRRVLDEHLAGRLEYYETEHRLRTKGGGWKWILDRGKVVERDRQGRPVRMAGTHTDLSYRKQIEEALLQSQENLLLAQQVGHVGSWEIDLKSDLRQWSAETYRIFGCEPGTFTPTSPTSSAFYELVHPEDRDRVRAAAQQARASGSDYRVEHRIVRTDGAERHVISAAHILRDASGRPARMIGTVQDVSDQKKAEAKLRESEERHRSVIEALSEGIALQDRDARIMTFNPSACRILGLSEEQLLGRTSLDPRWRAIREDGSAFPGEEHPAIVTLRTGQPQSEVVMGIHKPNDDLTWVSINSRPLHLDAQGRPDGVVVSFHDITLRKQAEAITRCQNAVLKKIADGRPLNEVLDTLTHWIERLLPGTLCSILLLDDDGITLRAGSGGSLPAAYNQAIDGVKSGEGVGSCGTAVTRRSLIIVTDISTDPLWANYRDLALSHGLRSCWSMPVFSTERRVLGSFAIYHREPVAPKPHAVALLEAMSALAGVAVERVRAEARIHRLNAELEQRVRERTAQLEAANAELESFSYSVSHDLRAPLRHVTGFASLLIKQPVVEADANTRRMADTISGAAIRMGELIDDLLVFSRMGRAELATCPVDTSRLVAEVRDELLQDASGRAIDWQIAPLPVVQADLPTLRQVFTNLLGNAVKYTRNQTQARIDVRCEASEHEFTFAVRDNGVGFDMQYADKLFGVFQRLHRDEDFEGTGIGLANVRRIITRHGGRTWADARPGEGAAFFFTLPRAVTAHRP